MDLNTIPPGENENIVEPVTVELDGYDIATADFVVDGQLKIGAAVTDGLQLCITVDRDIVDDIPDNTTAVGVPADAVKTRPAGWHLEP